MSDWDNWSDKIKGYGVSGMKCSSFHQFDADKSDDELYHHGILGMKWHIRRYQNPDGSLTEAGRKHYGRAEAKNVKKEEHQQRRESKAAAKLERRKEKHPKLYTDEEIKKRIERLKLDKQYKDLMKEMAPGQFARDMTKKVLTDAEQIAAKYAGNYYNWLSERPLWDRICSYLVKGGEAAGKITSGFAGIKAGGASLINATVKRDANKQEQEKEKNEQKLREKRNRFYGTTSD